MELITKVSLDCPIPLVYGVFDNEEININDALNGYVNKLKNEKLINLSLGAVNKIFPTNLPNKAIFLIGLGKKEEYNYQNLIKATSKITNKLYDEVIVVLNSFVGNLSKDEVLKKLLLTTFSYNYHYDECKSKKSNQKFTLGIYDENCNHRIIDEYVNLAIAINNTRDLVNKPYNYLNVNDLVSYCEELVNNLNNEAINLKVLNKDEIEKLGMNAFLGVNKGSALDAKLIHLTYQGNPNDEYFISLIGKGIMYDTGGYSIKEKMNNMKNDMGGAATALGIFEACVNNKLKVNIQVIVCATDNRISADALLPDDVVTAMNKKTIEIVSTDAEGRLTLADALTYAQRNKSHIIIDIATLTGAVCVALGEYTTGIFGNDKEMIKKICEYGEQENEHIWELPITDYIREKVRSSKVADLTNSTGRYMGASGAAAFLEEFIEEGSKWIHLDIAGTCFLTSPSYNEEYGATGVLVKTLYQYLKNY
ncbi:MAG TPA: leucyl aminopeptidase [Bacilli bacterium]